MIVVPVSNSVGWLDQFRIRVTKEYNDRPGTYNFTVCIKHMGDVVMSRSFVYNTDDDIREFVIDLGSLGSGLYEVEIFNWNGCYPPPNVLRFRYWLHRISSGPVLSFVDWTPGSSLYAFILYVFDNKLFWKYLVNVYDTVVPANVQVHVEASDTAGNGFVGSVSGIHHIVVRPNTRVPFIASFKIRYQDPVASDVVRTFTGTVWLMKTFYVNLIDRHTVELSIVKYEPGVPWKVVIVMAILFGVALFAYDVRVREIELEHRRLDNIERLNNTFNDAYRRYINALNACGDDLTCMMQVERLWFPVLQTISSNIGYLSNRFPSRCDGVNLGGVCMPWWVIGIVIFLAGLMVISVVRR